MKIRLVNIKEFDYYTKNNPYCVMIEDRGSRIGRYAIWMRQCCVNDCLTKKEALSLANILINEIDDGVYGDEFIVSNNVFGWEEVEA